MWNRSTVLQNRGLLWLFRGYFGLGIFLLLTARAELLCDAALFLLLPLLCAALLTGSDAVRSPLAPFFMENRQFLLPALCFTILFFVQLPLS